MDLIKAELTESIGARGTQLAETPNRACKQSQFFINFIEKSG